MGAREDRRRRAKQYQPKLLAALHRPERYEIERRADAYVAARERRRKVVAAVMLGGIGGGVVLAFLGAFGVL